MKVLPQYDLVPEADACQCAENADDKGSVPALREDLVCDAFVFLRISVEKWDADEGGGGLTLEILDSRRQDSHSMPLPGCFSSPITGQFAQTTADER